MITFSDFKKLDIRIGTITSAERLENADKLIKLLVDLGDEERQLVAGIAGHYTADELVGKQVPVLVNLEPATIRGVESQGMLLAADMNGRPVLLHPDSEIPEGSKVR